MALNLTFDVTIRDQQATVVAGYTPGDPGKYYGPPEDSYPAEPSDVEVESITLEDGSTLAFDDLTEDEQEAVYLAADEAYGEQSQFDDGPYEPEPDYYELPESIFDGD